MISRDISRVIISGATSSIGIALCEDVRDILSPGQEMGFGERPYNADAIMHLECDISELTADTGFVPMVDFEEGIRKLADTYIV